MLSSIQGKGTMQTFWLDSRRTWSTDPIDSSSVSGIDHDYHELLAPLSPLPDPDQVLEIVTTRHGQLVHNRRHLQQRDLEIK
jgi:hypothetical protein